MSALIKSASAAVLCILLAFGQTSAGPQSEEFRIDAASSKMVVNVGRSGIFGFAGHDHEVIAPVLDGSVTLNRTDVSRSKLAIRFDASAMKVTGKGEPAKDVPEVQRVMLSREVLDVERHPTIAFVSESIAVGKRSASGMQLRINGKLTLRGVEHRVTVPTEVELASDRLTAKGKAEVKQSDFGIHPVSAGAGTVKVKDEVELLFTIVAVPESGIVSRQSR
jgi:polyisoprenoid-binding protein YceI